MLLLILDATLFNASLIPTSHASFILSIFSLCFNQSLQILAPAYFLCTDIKEVLDLSTKPICLFPKIIIPLRQYFCYIKFFFKANSVH